MNLRLLLCVFYSAYIFSFASSQSNAVHTKSGLIHGTTREFRQETLDVYLGIPFAEPPVGNLRFKRPVSKKPWSVPLNATSQRAACVQYSDGKYPWKDDLPDQSEDCLYLNIWVPQDFRDEDPTKKAVLFWIHGGGYFLGSNRLDMYDARALASMGDVIVVTINYRLGVLGFYYSDIQDAPGNVAIYDIVEALRWVNKNIEYFGGDKDRITIYGASVGGMAAGLLTISPLSRHLFKYVIIGSGTPAAFFVDRNAMNEMASQAVAAQVKCANDTFTLKDNPKSVTECMRGKDALKLIKAERAISPATPIFFAHFGDELLPKDPRIAVIEKDFKNTSLLIGDNADEGSVFLTTTYPEIFRFFGEDNTFINETTSKTIINEAFAGISNVSSIINHYVGSISNNSEKLELRKQTYTALGDKLAVCPDVYFAEKFAEKRNEVFYYYFTHRPLKSNWAEWMGAAHYEEVKFTFGMPMLFPNNYTMEEDILSQNMIEIWTNFSKTGIPCNNWPLYSKEEPQIVYMDTERLYEQDVGPHVKNCNFLRSHLGF